MPWAFLARFPDPRLTGDVVVTIYGVFALTFMMTMYALEGRGRRFVLGFVCGCALSSAYGFASGAWHRSAPV